MKILGQKLADGSVTVIEAPDPILPPLCIRVRTLHSAVSPGTEGSKVITGRKSLVGKARAKPEQALQAVRMVSSLGLRNTILKVRSKLDGAQPLGYSLAGEVMETGDGVTGFEIGDLVACAGGGYANHADQAVIPVNLAVKIPEGVPPESAAFATLGAIALQGVRIAEPTLGESAVVIGLGVIGQLAGQILRAGGCRVFGIDISGAAVDLAVSAGSVDAGAITGQDPVEAAVSEFTRGRGADLVLICAGTSSSQPVELAGSISRKKGRVVVVGAVGMNLPREPYYRKEISFCVSCSYGPGRYDPTYEEGGLDYPYPYVRWTEGRNVEAVLDLMARGSVDPAKLVTHRRSLDRAPELYSIIASGNESFCGLLLDYPSEPSRSDSVVIPRGKAGLKGRLGIGFYGAGSFAQTFLLPPLKKNDRVAFSAICTRSGLTAADTGARLGFSKATGTLEQLIADEGTDAIVVATRHDEHGPAVISALEAGKPVFVEKPLCITRDELRRISGLLADGNAPLLMVGFNRRFSAAAAAVRKHLGHARSGPLSMMYRISAGHIPKEHWTQDTVEGGGRIIGEVCHFIDLMQFFCGAVPVEVYAVSVSTGDTSVTPEDNVVISLRFADGSVGSIGYFAEGAKSVPKERFEVFAQGRTGVIENFTRAVLYSGSGKKSIRCSGKGHAEEMTAFVDALSTGRHPISPSSMIATTLASMEVVRSLEQGRPRLVDPADLLGE